MNLLREYIRGLLIEDMARRQAFAQDLRGTGAVGSRTITNRQTGPGKERDDAYKKMIKMGRPLKQLYAKHSDQAWLKTLTTVHFVKSTKGMIDVLRGTSSRDELSAIAFLPGNLQWSGWGEAGIIVKGHITLLANDMDTLRTGAGVGYRAADPTRTKMSGANKGVSYTAHPDTYEMGQPLLVFDEKDWDPADTYFGGSGDLTNEALVDNWRPVGILLPDDDDDWPIKKFQNIVDKLGLDIPVMSESEARARL